MSQDLNGRTALVTGAGRGIGAAIARALANDGASVILASRTIEQLEKVASEIEARGGCALAVATDMANPGEVRRLVDRGLDRFGGLDMLVSNAAADSLITPLIDMPLAGWRKLHSVNVEGTITLLQSAGPHLLKQRSGSVLIVSSTLGLNGNPYSSAYGGSKAILNHITRTVAAEWGPSGVRVNALLPGPVATERVRSVTEDTEKYAAIRTLMPLRRWPIAEDMVGPALFLLTDASACVTGHLLVVDCGLSAVAREAGFAVAPRKTSA